MHKLFHCMINHKSDWLTSVCLSFFLFFLCFSDWIISNDLPLISLTFSSAWSSLLLKFSINFSVQWYSSALEFLFGFFYSFYFLLNFICSCVVFLILFTSVYYFVARWTSLRGLFLNSFSVSSCIFISLRSVIGTLLVSLGSSLFLWLFTIWCLYVWRSGQLFQS